jgi:membrane protein required for beta-lactamase induction
MSEPATTESTGKSFGRTALAALVFLVAAWLLLHVIIGVLSFLFSALLLVVAVVAVIWALRIIL